MKNMKKMVMVQPFLTSYRMWLYENFQCCNLTVLHSGLNKLNSGFKSECGSKKANLKFVKIPTLQPFGSRFLLYQAGIIGRLMSERPDVVIIFANIRYLSFWTTLVAGRLLNIRVYPHGHGLFKKVSPNVIYKLAYCLIGVLCSKYICYTDSVAKSLTGINFPAKKIAVANNSIENLSAVDSAIKSGEEFDLLFIGRLRERCEIEILVSAVAEVRDLLGKKINIHIIGDGILFGGLSEKYKSFNWVIFYGAVYDNREIAVISRNCRYGVYPGACGLSVVHYMSLSLPSIVHSNMGLHEGPEATYIKDEFNGFLFDAALGYRGLVNCLTRAYCFTNHRWVVVNSFNSYKNLIQPKLSERFEDIVFRQTEL